MDSKLMIELKNINVDTDNTIKRFAGNAGLFKKFLMKFPQDISFDNLTQAISENNTEDMISAVHTLKGVAGNLGLTRVYESSAKMTELLRKGDMDAAMAEYNEVKEAHEEICSLLKRFEEGTE